MVGCVVGRDCSCKQSTLPHELAPQRQQENYWPATSADSVAGWAWNATTGAAGMGGCLLSVCKVNRWRCCVCAPAWVGRRTNLKLGGQLGSAASVCGVGRVGSSKNGKAGQTRQDKSTCTCRAGKAERKMGKGGQENEARSSDHALCMAWVAWVVLPPSSICSPVRSTPGRSGKRNTWRGPVSFSQSSGQLLYSYESCGTSAQIR